MNANKATNASQKSKHGKWSASSKDLSIFFLLCSINENFLTLKKGKLKKLSTAFADSLKKITRSYFPIRHKYYDT